MSDVEIATLEQWLDEQLEHTNGQYHSLHTELLRAMREVKHSWFEKAQIFADSASQCSASMAFLAKNIPSIEKMCHEIIPHINSDKNRVSQFIWSVIAAAKSFIQNGKDLPVFEKIEHCGSPWAYLHCQHCKSLQHFELFNEWGAACVDCVEIHRDKLSA